MSSGLLPPETPSAAHAPRSTRIPDFVVFSAGHGVSSVGGWMQKTGVGWLAWELTHSPAWVGAIALSDLFSALWVAPLAGAVTDRSNPLRLMLITQSLSIGLALLLGGLAWSGHLTIGLLFVWAVLEASVQGFNLPVRMVAIGSLARPDQMAQAIASSSIAVSLARSVGPAIAGVVMVRGHVAGVFLINALSYLGMIAAVLWLRGPLDRPGLASRQEPLLSDVAAGVAYIRSTPRVATIFLLALGFAVLARPFVELFPAIAGDVLRGGPETLSLLMTAQGLGALCGALYMLKPKPADQTVRITFGAALGIALTLVVFSLTTQLHAVLLAIAVAGVFHVVCNIGMQTMAQTMSEPTMKGRVMSSYGLIFRAAPAIGATALGACAAWAPLQWLLGGAAAVFGLVVVSRLPEVRRVFAVEPASTSS